MQVWGGCREDVSGVEAGAPSSVPSLQGPSSPGTRVCLPQGKAGLYLVLKQAQLCPHMAETRARTSARLTLSLAGVP